MTRRVLIAKKGEGEHQELAGFLVEAQAGDEIIVESQELEHAARRALSRSGDVGVTIATNPALVAEECTRPNGR